jgi:CRISPR-associated protein Cas2
VTRRQYIVSYDVADDRRRTAIFNTLSGCGDHAQYSVFFCELDGRELAALRSTLRSTINHAEDQIMIVDLGLAERSLEERLQVLGRGYAPAIRTIVV